MEKETWPIQPGASCCVTRTHSKCFYKHCAVLPNCSAMSNIEPTKTAVYGTLAYLTKKERLPGRIVMERETHIQNTGSDQPTRQVGGNITVIRQGHCL